MKTAKIIDFPPQTDQLGTIYEENFFNWDFDRNFFVVVTLIGVTARFFASAGRL